MEGEQPAWAALTGQSYDDYQGYGWSKAVHPDDAEPTVEAWNEAVAARRTFVFEHRVRCRDGAWRSFAIRAIPVLNADGSIKEWVGVHTDITQQRQAEAVLTRDKAQLEQLVAERTRELESTQARLAHVQRMEALGQLAGGIAHDFNNVLQSVQGGAGLIERRTTDPEGVRRLARMVFDAASRGSAITRRLLTFSRRGDLRTEAVDPTLLLTDLREILTHTLGAGTSVRVDAPTGLPSLLADKGQLETVLINMATNARDAMGGTGVLTLAAAIEVLPKADGPRPVADLKAGSYVRLGVSDTGIGMTPEVLARVTEPFFTTKPQGHGTGLGLAMARGFIEQSGGGMLIESQPGHGTTVNIWLPMADAASMLDEPGGRAGKDRRGQTRRLLVVDDELLVREIITQQLEAAGHTVVSAGDSQEALALLDGGEPIDLIVSDLSMPGMDGIALVREANRRRPKLPAILLTGFATNAAEIAVGGAVSGLFSLLRKPVTEQELVERVAMLLEGTEVACLTQPQLGASRNEPKNFPPQL
jgi:PAS domain S-box-containing protein